MPTKPPCYVAGCGRTSDAVGLCHAHYEGKRRHPGKPLLPILDTIEKRFMAKVAMPDDVSQCWLWTGSTDGDGRYGSIQHEGKVQRAHRVAYLMLRGPIPSGMVIDHLCKVTLCVNPAHMDVVTQRENVMRGGALPALNAVKTHCKRGHELSGPNIRILRDGGRQCVVCERLPEVKARRAELARQRRAARSLDSDAQPCPIITGMATLPSDLLTAKEAAAFCDVYPDTLKRWVSNGLLPDLRTPGGHRRYRREDLAALLLRKSEKAS